MLEELWIEVEDCRVKLVNLGRFWRTLEMFLVCKKCIPGLARPQILIFSGCFRTLWELLPNFSAWVHKNPQTSYGALWHRMFVVTWGVAICIGRWPCFWPCFILCKLSKIFAYNCSPIWNSIQLWSEESFLTQRHRSTFNLFTHWRDLKQIHALKIQNLRTKTQINKGLVSRIWIIIKKFGIVKNYVRTFTKT